jgi:cellulose synthase/poly-beta-1,6-N-acetylglucosamine synthase-like glycosyltransferase
VGELLFFIDSDVMLRSDSLTGLAEAFEDRTVDALCGVQSAEMRHQDLVSQYKNLWMRWTYLQKTGDVPLFYTTAAAIRREAFLRAGGFDQGYATRTSRTPRSDRSSPSSASACASRRTSRSST